jgi:hypothetical protein
MTMSIIQPVRMLDYGNAPKYYVTGLGSVRAMGPVATFGFYFAKPQNEDGEMNVLEVELIMPVDSVGPAFDLTLESLGSRALAGQLRPSRLL